MKETVRLSFNVPAQEHILLKTACVQSREHMKDFLHDLLLLGLEEYQKRKLEESLKESIQQVKDGKTFTVTMEQLDRWEQMLDDESD